MAEGGEQNAESRIDDEKIVCDLCNLDVSEVESFKCIECNMLFCCKCTKCHMRIPITSKHFLISRTNLMQVRRMCNVHTANEISHYCYSCNVLICGKCIPVDHFRHKGIKIKELADRKKKAAWEKIQYAKEVTLSALENNIKMLEEMKKTNDKRLGEKKRMPNKLIAELEDNKEDMDTQIIERLQRKDDRLDELENAIANHKSLIEEFREIARNGSDIEVIKAEKLITNYLGKLENFDFDSDDDGLGINLPTFVPGEPDLEVLRRYLLTGPTAPSSQDK